MPKKIPVHERIKILKMRSNNITLKEIEKKTGRGRKTIIRLTKLFNQTGSVVDTIQKRSPRTISNKLRKNVLNMMKKRKHLSIRKTAKIFNSKAKTISKSSIHNILKQAGMKYKSPQKKPFLNESHKQKRLNFASNYKNKKMDFWKRIIWTDESCFEESGNIKKIWLNKNQKDLLFTKKSIL